MLVLTRKALQTIRAKIPDGRCITIQVVEIRGDKVRLGIVAPRDIPVHRGEVWVDIEETGIDRKALASIGSFRGNDPGKSENTDAGDD